MTEQIDDPLAALRALRQEAPEGEEAQEDAPQTQGEGQAGHELPDDETASFSGGAMVGQYAQRTVRLPPRYLALIRQMAEVEDVSIADAERWVVARGLQAYYEDGERPTFHRNVRRQIILPFGQKEA